MRAVVIEYLSATGLWRFIELALELVGLAYFCRTGGVFVLALIRRS
jgi:hypothetical protein